MEIKVKVKEFIFKLNRNAPLGEDDNIFQTGIVNSLFAIQLIMFIEKTFNIKISASEINPENFFSINKITEFIEGKLDLTAENE